MKTVRLVDYEAIPDDGFLQWLERTESAVIVSHSNKLIAFGRDETGEIRIDDASFDRVTGLAEDESGTLWVAADHELWTMSDAVAGTDRSPGGAHRWFMCRNGRFVGAVRPADLVPANGGCTFVSVALSALCSIDDTLSARVLWKPPFITKVAPGARCRLTGLGAIDGQPAVVTSASTSDEADGWLEHRRDGGVLIDIPSGEIVASGLSLPHSPRWYDGKWWLTLAGTGEVGFIDDGRFCPAARLDGFARGMTIVDGVALVGASGSRWDELVDGLPIGDRLADRGIRPESGVFAIDLATGGQIGAVRLDGTAREVSDVIALRSTRNVELSGPRGSHAQEYTTYPLDFAATRSGGAQRPPD